MKHMCNGSATVQNVVNGQQLRVPLRTRDTLCGKTVAESEALMRSEKWPRQSKMCPDCLSDLVDRRLTGKTFNEADLPDPTSWPASSRARAASNS